MPRKLTGTVFVHRGKYYGRFMIGPKRRRAFQLTTVTSLAEGEARARLLAELSVQLCASNQIELAARLIEAGACAQEGEELDEVVETVQRICTGELRQRPST